MNETIKVLSSFGVFINEVGNDIAQKAFEVAIGYIKKNPNLGLSVEYTLVEGNRTDSKGLLESICTTYAANLQENKKPHVIFDTTKTGVSSETVKSLSAALGIPTISASYGQDGDLRQWRELSEKKKAYLLQVNPPADLLTEVVRSIVIYMNITNAAILYDNSFVVDHKYKALLQNIPTRHVITAVAANKQAISEQITKLRNLDINNYFILGKIESVKLVLESAKKEYFERNFAWHAITEAKQDLTAAIENATVMFIRPSPDGKSKDRLGTMRTTYNLKYEPEIESAFYFDLAVRTFLSVKQILQVGAWPPNMKYLTCDEFDGTNSPEHTIDLKSYFVESTELPTYAPFEFGKGNVPFNGYSFMKFEADINAVTIRGGASVSTKLLGTWTAGLNNELKIAAIEEMRNMTADIVYRVYTVVQPPFIIRDESAPKGFRGYCIDLIDAIAEIVKFDYEIKEVEDQKFGSMNEKGEWNGVVRKLIDKQADIGLGSMSVMAERETVIDFTVPYYDLVGITIMMVLPSSPSSLFKFLTVLETNVWLCILAAYFFTRLVAATWWLFGFIIIASYTANLAAFLTVSRLDTPIESLDDLAKQYKVLYAPINGSSAMTYFERMADIERRFYEIWKDMSLNDSLSPVERSKLAVWDYPVSDKYTKMWQAMREAGLPNTLEEAVARVRNSTNSAGFAFLGDATDIRYQVLTSCDLQMVGEEFSRKPYALAVQQGSPLKDQFNNAILQLLNKRQLEKFKERWWKKDDISAKCEKPEDQSDGISIQNIGGVFIVIFVGIGMACITLAFEFWYYKLRKTPKIVSNDEYNKFSKSGDMATMKNNISFGSGGLIDPPGNNLKSRHPPANNFRARF
ncbi:unnamed protein product [Chironomus riparius]|uniref:Ionotropic receptor n=1 Tax=Chironomus riparius TaxID=315576 RepID=A0A9N9RK99_9DIPT|nr:unnamed protein product [Chironomus riparius]